MRTPKILILTVPHGAAPRRVANALKKALLKIQPGLAIEIVNALEHCARWFRAYYNFYEIPLKYFPSFWSWVESIQYRSACTGPHWLYRRGAKPLFRFFKEFDPDIVIATEVGMGELATLYKRETKARFYLVGLEQMDFNQAWVQPEVDLYPTAPGDLAAELEAAGVPRAKIVPCGLLIDPAFTALPDAASVRDRLGVERDLPMILALFGGAGYGNPRRILSELEKVKQPWQAVFIMGRNPRLENDVRELCRNVPGSRVLGWVDNIHEWMAAADLILGKPGGATVAEAINLGAPFLAFDPLPGNERRTCGWIEKWGVGLWVRRAEDLAPTVERLLTDPEERVRLRANALRMARPRAAFDAAEAILNLTRLPSVVASSSSEVSRE